MIAGGWGNGSTLDQLNCPLGLALGNDGKLYISDSGNDRILALNLQALDAKGAIQVVIDQDIDTPHGIAIDSDNHLYIADFGTIESCVSISMQTMIIAQRLLPRF